MAIDLIFSVSQENRNGELFLIVEIQEKGSFRILYVPTLKEFGKQVPELSSLLIQEHCKDHGMTPMSYQVATLACNKIKIKAARSLEVLQKLIQSKKLHWKGKSLFYNPLSKSKVLLDAEDDKGLLHIAGFIEMDGKKDPISSVEFLFLGKQVWGIHKQIVFVLPESVRASWIDYVYPESQSLEGRKRERFLADFREDPPEDFPETKWMGSFVETNEISTPQLLPALPCLVLKDMRGAFADLKMEYPTKTVDFQDPCVFPGRDLKTEKSWEKDL